MATASSQAPPNGEWAESDDANNGTSKAYIAVMGPTGSGKSSLIGSITGRADIVGHNLESKTAAVKSYEVTIDQKTLVLVDTPGFDDTNTSDHEILREIAVWLEKSCEKGQPLSGLVYLHRINNTRMAGSAVRALHLFQRICGQENYKSVILATTFWNTIVHCKEQGIEREQRLLENEGFWKSMRDRGARVARLGRNYREILPLLIELTATSQIKLEIQQELGDGLKLEGTLAGLYIRGDDASLQEEYERDMARLQQEFAEKLETKQRQFNTRRQSQQHAESTQKLELQKMEQNCQFMEKQLEMLRANQRLKEAEVAARLQEKQAQADARIQQDRIRKAQEERMRREAESRQRSSLSVAQRTVIDQQIDLLRASSAGGVAQARIRGIDLEGLGMASENGTNESVTRSGLNRWCDFCLEPFGLSGFHACAECKLSGVSKGFCLCDSCYHAGHRCLDQSHDLTVQGGYDEFAAETFCLRFYNPGRLTCDVAECKQSIEGLYLRAYY